MPLVEVVSVYYFKDKLKATYRHQFEKHKINVVDKKKTISMKEVKIAEFAVKIKMSRDKPAEGKYRDEVRRYMENLKVLTVDNTELSQLVQDDIRVTFVRGIAGMGKSVLAKQLALGWATDKMYTTFKLCIMFECRDLNYFVETDGKKLSKSEIFEEFLRRRCTLNLADGTGILFVVDGLDELYDINTEDSIIKQLLNIRISKYKLSKVIITGRPHVQEKLVIHGDEMGDLQTFEIQGLSDDQICDYIGKFPSVQVSISAISNWKEMLDNNLSILHVPQFLNTFCCVASFTKGEAIKNLAELYSWAIFLLLKQHGACKPDSSNERVSEIFVAYSPSLVTLTDICYELLNENQIIFEEKAKLLLGHTETEVSFLESFFSTVPHNFRKIYQFKHLSLMEFLAALHICNNTMNLKETIKECMKKGFVDVVCFTCSLIAGSSSEGIIKELLRSMKKFVTIDEKIFLKNVLNIFNESEFDDKTKFRRSIDIICWFLKNDFTDDTFLPSIISQLKFDSWLDVWDINNLVSICHHLNDVCQCPEYSIRKAFENVRVQMSYVNKLNQLQCIKYLNVDMVQLIDIKANMTEIIAKLENFEWSGGDKRLGILRCTMRDVEEMNRKGISFDERFRSLLIVKCNLNIKSFKNICQLGTSCEEFRLLELDIRGHWWEVLVKMIEEGMYNETLKLKRLYIRESSWNMSQQMEIRVRGLIIHGYFSAN